MRLFRAGGEALRVGVETWEIEGVAVRITNLPRTVADCFKYRNKIGLDIALEALKLSQQEFRYPCRTCSCKNGTCLR